MDTWLSGKNKPNSNPIKPNLRKAKMNVNLTLTKDYRKKNDFAVQKNKAKQTQSVFLPLLQDFYILYPLQGTKK